MMNSSPTTETSSKNAKEQTNITKESGSELNSANSSPKVSISINTKMDVTKNENSTEKSNESATKSTTSELAAISTATSVSANEPPQPRIELNSPPVSAVPSPPKHSLEAPIATTASEFYENTLKTLPTSTATAAATSTGSQNDKKGGTLISATTVTTPASTSMSIPTPIPTPTSTIPNTDTSKIKIKPKNKSPPSPAMGGAATLLPVPTSTNTTTSTSTSNLNVNVFLTKPTSKPKPKLSGKPSKATSNSPLSLGTKNAAAVATSAAAAAARQKKRENKAKKQSKKRKAMEAAGGTAAGSGSGSTSRRGSEDIGMGGVGDSRKYNKADGGTKKPGPKKGKKKKQKGENAEIPQSIQRRLLPTAAYRDQDPNSSTIPNTTTSTGKAKKSKKKQPGQKLGHAQAAVKDMMRQLLEEDKYSNKGSIVDTDSSDDDDDEQTIFAIASGAGSSKRSGSHYGHHGGIVSDGSISLLKLDRATLMKNARKRLKMEELWGVRDTNAGSKKRANSVVLVEEYNDYGGLDGSGDVKDGESGGGGRKKKRKKGKRGVRQDGVGSDGIMGCVKLGIDGSSKDMSSSIGKSDNDDNMNEEEFGADESSIFGQTTGGSNATWVECDKCKKWRRLRGVVDAKKLPTKWFCSMNKKDPERSKCSAPEEEYEAANTPENAAEQRTRKHIRLWVRRLQCNENYEARLPTMTRGKKRNTTSAKEPYEWIRCCNPSCGKWRALLRSMDAASVIDAARNGEWYCVLNTWDEKTASCAAPQESLPAIGCPPWVITNDN